MKKILIFAIALLNYCIATAQTEIKSAVKYPKIGDTIQDYKFTDVFNSSEKTVTTRDFRGKWLVIDFWASSCVACVASFPHVNQLFTQFNGKAEIMMVGLFPNKKNAEGRTWELITKNIYRYHQKKHNLTFPMAFDSLAMEEFDINGVPAILVVNPQGIIAAKCIKLDSLSLARLIAGESPQLDYSYSKHETKSYSKYNYISPFLVSGHESNGGIDSNFMYRSLLSKYDSKTMPSLYTYGWENVKNDPRRKNFAEAVGVDLTMLIRIGNYGTWLWSYNDPGFSKRNRDLILEVKNDSLFCTKNKKNWFTYSVALPLNQASPQNFRKTLLEDIERYFGFVSAIEIRKSPIYKLIIIDHKKASTLKTRGGIPAIKQWERSRGYDIVNMPITQVLRTLNLSLGFEKQFAEKKESVPPIIDATGITYNIDMKFTGDVIDAESTFEVLHRYGLDLILDKADMERIVVRDAPPASL